MTAVPTAQGWDRKQTQCRGEVYFLLEYLCESVFGLCTSLNQPFKSDPYGLNKALLVAWLRMEYIGLLVKA